MRTRRDKYPDYSAELEFLRENEPTVDIIQRIIRKHRNNSKYNHDLHERYEALQEAVPIFQRTPRFDGENALNNKINNDFFSEIIDIKTGYFAGAAASYSYSSTKESEATTGGEEAVDAASKALTDFTTRNNMYSCDMEVTKNAAICGYSGRLFYIDGEGNERCMIVPGYETIVLSATSITEPEFAIRYYSYIDIKDQEQWKAEFYDAITIRYYEGQPDALHFVEQKPHMFDCCPLQGIPNNSEMMGDAEKVLSVIDEYDKTVSDNANDIENFANAYMIFENIQISDEEIAKGQASGSFKFYSGPNGNGKIYYLTKDFNDAFIEHHLDRLEDNIYRFSKTPNLNDSTFGTSTGVALKFKLTSLETKCGMFEAQMMSAAQYMFNVLASSWAKKKITVDPLQCVVDYKRNFPLDTLSSAQAAQALIAAGVPKKIAWDIAIPDIDDPEFVWETAEAEKDDIPSLAQDIPGDDEEEEDINNASNEQRT